MTTWTSWPITFLSHSVLRIHNFTCTSFIAVRPYRHCSLRTLHSFRVWMSWEEEFNVIFRVRSTFTIISDMMANNLFRPMPINRARLTGSSCQVSLFDLTVERLSRRITKRFGIHLPSPSVSLCFQIYSRLEALASPTICAFDRARWALCWSISGLIRAYAWPNRS
jgi:hypothetical protein